MIRDGHSMPCRRLCCAHLTLPPLSFCSLCVTLPLLFSHRGSCSAHSSESMLCTVTPPLAKTGMGIAPMLISYVLIMWWCRICAYIAPLCMLPMGMLQHNSGYGCHRRGQSLYRHVDHCLYSRHANAMFLMWSPCSHLAVPRPLYIPDPVCVLMRICCAIPCDSHLAHGRIVADAARVVVRDDHHAAAAASQFWTLHRFFFSVFRTP